MPDANKVQFNLKNVHYALITNTNGVISWGTPVHVPGAVTLTLEPQGNTEPFHADGITYYQSIANNGYSGDLEMARFPDKMLEDVWGFNMDETDKVLTEDANTEPRSFALLYQIDGDKNEDNYCLYNCSGTRPGIGGTTNTESKTPQTKSSTISAIPMADGKIMARTTSDTPKNIREDWYKQVYKKTTNTEADNGTNDSGQ